MKRRAFVAALSAFLFASASGIAQTRGRSSIVLLDRERLMTDSATGRKIIELEQRAQEEVGALGRRYDTELEAEELRLTQLRPETDPELFREMAEAFDEKVTATRSSHEQKSLEVTQILSERRKKFDLALGPIVREILLSQGATVVLDARSVLYADPMHDITDLVIRQVDLVLLNDPDILTQ
jgi:Skp family chaperone for outer membrane proteins